MKTRIMLVLIVVAVMLLGAISVGAQDSAAPATVMMGSNDALGSFLVGANGFTLYLFKNDEPAKSNCAGDCAVNWPPLTVGEGERPTLDAGVPGRLGVITRDDGSRQVTYNGMPLYFFKNDAAAGDTNGQGRGDVWYVVNPPLVSLGGNADLGDFLVGANGFTLYLFKNDAPGTSNCYDQCATNWPPVLADSADAVTTQPGIVGTFGTIERTDGTIQVTYNDMPLYFFMNDAAVGDATGQGRNDVWYVVKPLSVSVSSNADLGDFLVGPNGMTLYLFTNDTEGVSNCADQCAVAWPPLLVAEGETPTAGEGVTGELSVITRADGGLQVAYNGVPLYYWINDVVPGDTTGQGVRDVWFIVSP
ncbi:MAG: hypothetical protein K8I60_07085 [Anaerolineae bacterium]|nr:hypothetical protein [Anaerolineae bacterium]